MSVEHVKSRAHRRNWGLIPIEDQAKYPDYEKLSCTVCGKFFLRDPYIKGRKPRFCSHDCSSEMQRRQKKALATLEKKCEVCGSSFYTDKWKFDKKKFCSVKCQYRAQCRHGGVVTVPCSICGKEVKRRKDRITQNVYCGYDCMAKGKILPAPRTNGWANVRTWFGRFGRMSECEKCGYDKVPEVLVIHHKDRDRRNNDLSNLMVLCPTCHAIEHLEENKKGWKHQSTDPIKMELREMAKARRKNAVV